MDKKLTRKVAGEILQQPPTGKKAIAHKDSTTKRTRASILKKKAVDATDATKAMNLLTALDAELKQLGIDAEGVPMSKLKQKLISVTPDSYDMLPKSFVAAMQAKYSGTPEVLQGVFEKLKANPKDQSALLPVVSGDSALLQQLLFFLPKNIVTNLTDAAELFAHVAQNANPVKALLTTLEQHHTQHSMVKPNKTNHRR